MKIKNILLGVLLANVLMAGVAMADTTQNTESPNTNADRTQESTANTQQQCQDEQSGVWVQLGGTAGTGKCVVDASSCSILLGKNPDEAEYEMAFNPGNKDNGVGGCYWALKGGVIDAQSTILPFTSLSVSECESLYANDAMSGGGLFKKYLSGEKGATVPTFTPDPNPDANHKASAQVLKVDILGCGIKTGRMKLWMVPYYIKSILQFALSLSGLIAVGAMVFGGYFYMFGTLMDDKEKGKRSIIYGLGGFVLVLLAWAIVNVVISLVTM